MWAVICRSRGGLSANGKEGKNASNDKEIYSATIENTVVSHITCRLCVHSKKSISLWILQTRNSGTQHCLILSQSRSLLGKIFLLRHQLTDLLTLCSTAHSSQQRTAQEVLTFLFAGILDSLLFSTSLSQTTTILRPGFSFDFNTISFA